MCTKAPIQSDDSPTPIVNSQALSDSAGAPRNQVKPTSVISGPIRCSGRCHHTNSPVAMKPQPRISASTTNGAPDVS